MTDDKITVEKHREGLWRATLLESSNKIHATYVSAETEDEATTKGKDALYKIAGRM